MEKPPCLEFRKLLPSRSEGSLATALSDAISGLNRLKLHRSNIETTQETSWATTSEASRGAARGSAAKPSSARDDASPLRLTSKRLVHELHKVARKLSRTLRPRTMDPVDLLANDSARQACVKGVEAIFGDICPRYLETLIDVQGHDAGVVINYIVDQEDNGKPYARKLKPNGTLKRKRSRHESAEDQITRAKQVYDNPERRATFVSSYNAHRIRKLISGDFPFVPVKTVQHALAANNRLLLPTYLVIYNIAHGKDQNSHPRKKKLRRSPQEEPYLPEHLDGTIQNCPDPTEKAMLEELQTARHLCSICDKEDQDKATQEADDERNFDEAKANGLLIECQCCFVEHPINRLVHCNGEIAHGFCVDCARRQAETLVGLSKYELTCMSMNNCDAAFSTAERVRFLDDKLSAALDRIEQEAVLRLAGLENLVNCPFCPFAAECPSVERDKEFRCQNPECQLVSCRLCKSETHIPKSCAEAAKEKGYSARRNIEEAMSAAMIRKCNKCATPFIKEQGCNKMTCTRQGCRNVQCYICSKSCDYSHFNDTNRGGKAGNCVLFDSAESRHDEEVREAEASARKEVVDQRPDIDPNLLKFDMSKKVVEDDQRRREGDYPVRGGFGGQIYNDEAIRAAVNGRRARVRPAAGAGGAAPYHVVNPDVVEAPGPFPIHMGPAGLPVQFPVNMDAAEPIPFPMALPGALGLANLFARVPQNPGIVHRNHEMEYHQFMVDEARDRLQHAQQNGPPEQQRRAPVDIGMAAVHHHHVRGHGTARQERENMRDVLGLAPLAGPEQVAQPRQRPRAQPQPQPVQLPQQQQQLLEEAKQQHKQARQQRKQAQQMAQQQAQQLAHQAQQEGRQRVQQVVQEQQLQQIRLQMQQAMQQKPQAQRLMPQPPHSQPRQQPAQAPPPARRRGAHGQAQPARPSVLLPNAPPPAPAPDEPDHGHGAMVYQDHPPRANNGRIWAGLMREMYGAANDQEYLILRLNQEQRRYTALREAGAPGVRLVHNAAQGEPYLMPDFPEGIQPNDGFYNLAYGEEHARSGLLPFGFRFDPMGPEPGHQPPQPQPQP